MLTQEEQKMVIEALNKMALDLQVVIKNQEQTQTQINSLEQKLESKIEALNIKIDSKVEYLDLKIDGAKNETKAIGEKMDAVLAQQDKRISDMGSVRNLQQSWFLGIQTVLIGTIVTVLIKFGFFN